VLPAPIMPIFMPCSFETGAKFPSGVTKGGPPGSRLSGGLPPFVRPEAGRSAPEDVRRSLERLVSRRGPAAVAR
jgi:hypothetical protein